MGYTLLQGLTPLAEGVLPLSNGVRPLPVALRPLSGCLNPFPNEPRRGPFPDGPHTIPDGSPYP